MEKSNKPEIEIIHEEMMDLAKLVLKYSQLELSFMIAAVNISSLQYDMERNGATRDEIRTASECHHDIHEWFRKIGCKETSN